MAPEEVGVEFNHNEHKNRPIASHRAQTSVEITALTTFAPLSGLLDPYNAESFGDYAVWCTQQQRGKALHSAVAHLKGKCGKMLTSLSPLSRQHRRRHRRTRTAVSLSLNLSLVLIYIMDGSFSLQDRVNT